MTGELRQLNIRVDPELIRELEEIAYEEHLEKANVTRKLLIEGVQRWKLEHALKLYREGRITKERAAELAEVSLYEIVDAVREQRIPSTYRLDDLKEDLRALYQRELPN